MCVTVEVLVGEGVADIRKGFLFTEPQRLRCSWPPKPQVFPLGEALGSWHAWYFSTVRNGIAMVEATSPALGDTYILRWLREV